jgi:colanic acid biosynthesis glycosyl transferase WcaI
MKKRILLIGYNFYPELTGIGKYSGEMIQWLAKNGYDCTVITSYPYYPYWKVQEPYSSKSRWYSVEEETFSLGGKIKVYRCPIYVPVKPSGLKRILLDFSFLISAGGQLLRLLLGKKFHTVLVIAPSFQFGLLGILYKKLCGSRLLYHIQDMQIEAARDLQMIRSKKIINILFKVEKYIFNQSDIVSTISENMVRRVAEKAEKDVLLFPNWADTTLFYPIEDRGALKMEFGFEATDIIVLYSGAIGEKQGLEAIIQTADQYKSNNSLKFVICGSGPYKKKLQEHAQSLELQNVVFMPLQPFEKFNAFLNSADIHLIIQKADASDLVMPSKLTTILAIGGLALITSNEGSGLHTLVQKHKIGLLVQAENQQALNAGIEQALSEDNKALTINARLYAEKYLSIDNIMKNLENSLMAD